MSIAWKLRNLIRSAVTSGPADNTKQFPVQQITYSGKQADALTVSPYGLYSNLPNDVLGVLLSVEGDVSNKALLAYTAQDRPDDLEPGEVAYFHPATKTFIKLRNSGNLEIDTDVDSSGGQLIINAANVNLTAETVAITGDLTVSGSIVATGDVTGDGVSLSGHVHAGSATAPDGPVSSTGVPL